MQQGGRLQNDGGTENAYPAHEKGTQTGDDPISGAQVGRTFAAAIEDQQLMLDQHGFGNNDCRNLAEWASTAAVRNQMTRLNAASRPGFRPDTVCDNFIAGGDPMPTPARGKGPLTETLSLEERVRRRAYELYVQRGNESGSEVDDWIQAEEELRQAEEEARKDD
jgi:hypothetical protein